MTTATLTEHTVTVAGKPIFVAETGSGPAVVMLHGGGPGASGVSNYSRNIDALATHFRVIVPDMPGYGRSVKGVDQSDPFGYLADMIRGLLDELGHRHRPPDRQLLRRRRCTAPRPRYSAPRRQAGADGTRRDRDDAGRADGGAEEPAVLLRRRRTEPREARDLHPHLPGLRRRFGARRSDRPALPGVDRSRGGREPAAAPPVGPDGAAHAVAHGSHPRQPAQVTADPDAGVVGPRRQGQPAGRRADAAQHDAQRRAGDDLAHRALDAVGTRRAVQRLVTEFLSGRSRLRP